MPCASVSPPRLSGLPHRVIYRLALKPGWNGGSYTVRVPSPRRLTQWPGPCQLSDILEPVSLLWAPARLGKMALQHSPWLVAPPAPNSSPVTQMYPEVLASSTRQGHLQRGLLKVPWAPTCPCPCLPVTLVKSLPLGFPAPTLAAL